MLEVSTGEIGVVAVLKLFNSLINLDCLLHNLQRKVGATLESNDAANDCKAPVPWRDQLANPGCPLKVSGHEEETLL